MKWEDLKVYKPLKKEDLKNAYKEFTQIVAKNLNQYGFELKGRKLIKQSNNLFHIIHLDTRGSWMGISDSFKTEISICAICDTDTFVLNYELTASKTIEELIPKIRNHYRISQEYQLLADFITRKIVETILPYFSNYKTSKDILNNKAKFNLEKIHERNENLILYCELSNNMVKDSFEILTKRLIKIKSVNINDNTEEELLLNLMQEKNWVRIIEILSDKKEIVFKKLKLKTQS